MRSLAAIISGPLLAAVCYALLPEAEADATGAVAGGLTGPGRTTAAVAVLMAVWWLTEALPLAATALVPIALFPLLGATSAPAATAPYGDKVIFLFMGGFMIATAMQRWELHRRFALHTIRLVGTGPDRLVAGFMLAAAALSMWVSNTATVIMMLPIATSVLELLTGGGGPRRGEERAQSRRHDNFATCLLLGIAYGASVGGVGTLIGTPPNGILAGFVYETYGVEITFSGWMLVGLPVVVLFLPLTWLALTRLAFPFGRLSIGDARRLLDQELAAMGPMSVPERRVLIVFSLTALCWVSRRLIVKLGALAGLPCAGLNDTSIAIVGALALFILPAGDGSGRRLLDWPSASRLPWQILVLFGGGLSLAAAIKNNGVAEFIGSQFSVLHQAPVFWIMLLVTAVVIFLTELTSNTATTSALLPIFAAVADAAQVHPFLLLIPATVAASFAFMLPVATPPNALVFASGRVTIRQMTKAGLWLNLAGILLIPLITFLWMKLVPGPTAMAIAAAL